MLREWHSRVEVRQLNWERFYSQWRNVYKQSQHVTLIGPTGCGKTTLGIELIRPREYVVAFGVKYRDDTLERLIKEEKWKRIKSWPPRVWNNRVVLWPTVDDPRKMLLTHRKAFSDALADIYKKGGWCVWLDEERYLSDHLKMKDLMTLMYVTARSNNISIVGSAQRPRWIPLEAYSQAGHLIIWRTGDEQDLKRLGSLNGINAREVSDVVTRLPYHAFLHVNLVNGQLTVSQYKV